MPLEIEVPVAWAQACVGGLLVEVPMFSHLPRGVSTPPLCPPICLQVLMAGVEAASSDSPSGRVPHRAALEESRRTQVLGGVLPQGMVMTGTAHSLHSHQQTSFRILPVRGGPQNVFGCAPNCLYQVRIHNKKTSSGG